MTEMRVRLTKNETDIEAVSGLCRLYRTVLAERWPDHPQFLSRVYAADDFEEFLNRLGVIHQRPEGAIFVAEKGGEIIGCGMTHGLGHGVCEIKRMFVTDAARGTGAGRAIFVAAMEQARQDGYSRMVLDTTTRLNEAISLYESLGFVEIEPFYEPPSDFIDHMLFFGRDL